MNAMPTGAQVDWGAVLRFPWLVPLAVVLVAWRAGKLLEDWAPERQRSLPPPARSPGWARLGLLGALLSALGLRLYRIGAEPMDLLEYTYFFMSAGGRGIADLLFAEISLQQAHQPLQHLILALLDRLSSANEAWMRLPSALLGTAAIAVVWTWLRELFKGRERLALGAAWLVALHPIELWYGRDMTPYGLFALLAAGSYLCLWRGLERGTHWRPFVVLSVLGFYLHYYEIWVLFSQILLVAGYVLLSEERPRPWRAGAQAMRAMTFAALCVVPWLPFFFRALTLGYASLNVTGAAFSADLTLLQALPEGYRQIIGLPPELWGPAPGVLAAALQTLGAALLLRRERAAAIAILAPIAGGIVTELIFYWKLHSLTEGYYLQIRHYIYLIPSSIVLLLAGGERLCRLLRPLSPRLASAALPLAALGLLTIQVEYGWRFVAGGQRGDLRTMVREIRARAEDGDAIAVLPASFYSHLFGYYFFEDEEDQGDLFGSAGWHTIHAGSGPPATIFVPLTQFQLPFRFGVENLFFERLWIVHFQEEVLDLRKFSDAPHSELLARLSAQGQPLASIEGNRIRADLVRLEHRRKPTWHDDRLLLDMGLMETEHAWMLRRTRDAGGGHRLDLRIPLERGGGELELRYRIRWESRHFLPPRRIGIEVAAGGRRIERFTFQEPDGVRRIAIGDEHQSPRRLDLSLRSDRPLWFKQPPHTLDEGFCIDWLVLERSP